MHADVLIPLILEEYPELSPVAKATLEAHLRQLIITDRRTMLGNLQTEFALLKAPNSWRRILDSVLLDDSDIAPFCWLPQRTPL